MYHVYVHQIDRPKQLYTYTVYAVHTNMYVRIYHYGMYSMYLYVELRTATIKKKSAGLKPTSQDYQDIFGSDESDGLPDIDPDSLSRPPLRTKGHPTENVLACEGQRVRRSVRTQKSSVLKAKLPDM